MRLRRGRITVRGWRRPLLPLLCGPGKSLGRGRRSAMAGMTSTRATCTSRPGCRPPPSAWNPPATPGDSEPDRCLGSPRNPRSLASIRSSIGLHCTPRVESAREPGRTGRRQGSRQILVSIDSLVARDLPSSNTRIPRPSSPPEPGRHKNSIRGCRAPFWCRQRFRRQQVPRTQESESSWLSPWRSQDEQYTREPPERFPAQAET